MTRFKIVITEIGTELQKTGGEWAVIGQTTLKESEVIYDNQKDKLKSVYGYTPEIIKDVNYEREILAQEVNDLDLPAVIKAINKL